MLELKGKYGKDCKVFIDEVEESALATIYAVLDDEVSANVPVRIMPDTHNGVDIVIGFTMPLTDRVNPNHIGVDIGCGVTCLKLESLHVDLAEADAIIRKIIPMGFAHRHDPLRFEDDSDFLKLAKKIGQDNRAVCSQLGTLGGGNHFIEIGRSRTGFYLFIHSGSRNFGLQVCRYHANKAKENGSKYLFRDDMAEYLADMKVAQEFASLNRVLMGQMIVDALGIKSQTVCDAVHNYIDFERSIIRKGAVRAEAGEVLVIPMNMRDGVLLCTGKGNEDWNYSAPHGAGRVLARNEAKRKLDLSEFEREMEGVFSTSVCASTLDESPMAYKNMQTIIDCIGDTVDVREVIKPLLNIKAR